MSRIADIARALTERGLDGWLFYDFRHSDPLAYRILELPSSALSTRRWFYFIPANGEPHAVVSAVEPNNLESLPGRRSIYRSDRELRHELGAVLNGARRIAMNYSPECAIPYVSRVDAGTVELVRSFGAEVHSAADLIQLFEATLSPLELASHRRAGSSLMEIVGETFAEIAWRIMRNESITEASMQNFVLARISAYGLTTRHPPIIAVNAHAALPHYSPTAEQATRIKPGDLVLLDLWAKEPTADAIYADFTWMAYVGDTVPDEYSHAFALVAEARDTAVKLVENRVTNGAPVTGEEADRAARGVIEKAGLGEAFVHRTGHSIGREVHGNGANLDSLETRDSRRLLENACFSIEPGIYFPGRFGIRSEIDMTIEDGAAIVTTGALQTEVIPLLRAYREESPSSSDPADL